MITIEERCGDAAELAAIVAELAAATQRVVDDPAMIACANARKPWLSGHVRRGRARGGAEGPSVPSPKARGAGGTWPVGGAAGQQQPGLAVVPGKRLLKCPSGRD